MAAKSDPPASSISARKRLGELALEKGLISSTQLDDALKTQGELTKLGLSERIGTILFKKKVLSKQDLDSLLKEQTTSETSVRTKSKRLGNFELYEKVGQGAMGVVFRARQITMDRIVAVKILAPKYANDESFIKRFVREARAAGQFSHENIVTALDVGYIEPYHYFVMEYVEGKTLRKVIEERGPLPEKEALAYAMQIAKGLDHALTKKILHRDVKPENVIVTSQDIAKLLDMGLACAVGANEDEDAADADPKKRKAAGTPHYISPEAAKGEELDTRADIYSLGCTLFHMLAGTTPYEGTNGRSIMARQVAEPFPEIKQKRANVSENTARILAKMTAKDRAKRYANPQEFVEDAGLALEGSSLKHALGDGKSGRLRGGTGTTGPRAPIGERGTTGPRSPIKPRGTTTGPASPIMGDRTGSLSPTQPGGSPGGARAKPSSTGMWIGVGLAGVIVLGLGVALLGGDGGKQTAKPAPRKPDAAPAPARPEPEVKSVEVKAPAGPTREQLAREALDAAEKLAKDAPENYPALLAAFDRAGEQARETPLAKQAGDGLAAAQERLGKALDGVLKEMQDKADAARGKGDWRGAVDAFRDEAVAEHLRAGDWRPRLDGARQAERAKAEAEAAKHLGEARAKTQALNAQGFEEAIALAQKAEAVPAEFAPSSKAASEEKQRWTEALAQLRQAETQAASARQEKGRELAWSVRKEMQALLQAKRFAAARDLLDGKLRDRAFADAREALGAEKADLDALLALRQEAIEALRKRAGEKISLSKGNTKLNGTLKDNGGDRAVGLKLAEGPEFSLSGEQLEADDVDAHAPAGQDAKEGLRRRGLLYLADGDFARGKDFFAKARDAGLGDAAAPYLERIERLETGDLELKARRDWAEAEAAFKSGKLKEAHLMYLNFERAHAKAKAYAEHANELKERLAAIEAALNPSKPGLIAHIFRGSEFKPEEFIAARVDAKVDYDWGGGGPGDGLPNDDFCIRWFGTIKIEKAGHYTFATSADDGTRITVNGKQLTNDWTTHPMTRFAGEIDLAAGSYEIKLEYYEKGGGAGCRLYWGLKDGFPETIIPPEALSHNPALEQPKK
ncbi:MAG: protein kinase [Planctomycetota bacterium]|nr:protein kinase [Planctomycetota bacterium]